MQVPPPKTVRDRAGSGWYHKGKGTDRSHDSAGPSSASLVKSREGTFKPPKPMERYLKKHLRRCQEREALFKEHPLPDIDACTPPKPDKYLMDHLGKCFPKDFDSRLNKVQTAVLAITRPVVSTWQSLLEGGLEEDPEVLVAEVEVLSLCQRVFYPHLFHRMDQDTYFEVIKQIMRVFVTDNTPLARWSLVVSTPPTPPPAEIVRITGGLGPDQSSLL
jgi:hypothetical protein